MEETLDLKETLEVLEGLKVLAVLGGEVSADGKIDVKDLPALLAALKDVEKLSEAVKHADVAVKELKDLDEGEVIVLIAKVYEVVNAFKDAKKAA